MAVKQGTRPTHSEIERMEMLLEPPTGDDLLEDPVTFRSRGRGFRVVQVGQRRWMDQGMQQVSAGITHEFAPNGELVTNDRRTADFLRGLESFNRDFWEVGNEPNAVPSSEPVIDKIMQLAIELDDDALAEIERQEREGYERADVITAVTKARARVQGLAKG